MLVAAPRRSAVPTRYERHRKELPCLLLASLALSPPPRSPSGWLRRLPSRKATRRRADGRQRHSQPGRGGACARPSRLAGCACSRRPGQRRRGLLRRRLRGSDGLRRAPPGHVQREGRARRRRRSRAVRDRRQLEPVGRQGLHRGGQGAAGVDRSRGSRRRQRRTGRRLRSRALLPWVAGCPCRRHRGDERTGDLPGCRLWRERGDRGAGGWLRPRGARRRFEPRRADPAGNHARGREGLQRLRHRPARRRRCRPDALSQRWALPCRRPVDRLPGQQRLRAGQRRDGPVGGLLVLPPEGE